MNIIDQKLHRGHTLTTLNRQWRTTLDVGNLAESLAEWPISASMIIAALTVTATVTGLTANLADSPEVTPYSLLRDTSYEYGCMFVNKTSSPLSWKMKSGSYFQVNPLANFCPTTQALLLLGTINLDDASNYAYADFGVAVNRSAIGAPASFYAPRFYKNSSSDLVNTTACAPVLTKNPFQCRRINTTTFNRATKTLRIWNKWNDISNTQVTDIDETPPLFNFTLHDSVGQANLLIAHVGLGASYAAQAIGDSGQISKWKTEDIKALPMSYGIECTVDVSIQPRNVTLRFQDGSDQTGAFTRTLNATKELCDLGIPFEMNQLAATSVMAPYQILHQGWFEHIRNVVTKEGQTDSIRPGPFAFSESRNALEDVLGLLSALALSRVGKTADTKLTVDINGTSFIQYTRVGPGSHWALFLVLPALSSAILLLILWWKAAGSTSAVTDSLVRLQEFIVGSQSLLDWRDSQVGFSPRV
jgi:hypothetical protein